VLGHREDSIRTTRGGEWTRGRPTTASSRRRFAPRLMVHVGQTSTADLEDTGREIRDEVRALPEVSIDRDSDRSDSGQPTDHHEHLQYHVVAQDHASTIRVHVVRVHGTVRG
jgi:hypothetical protein